MINPELEHFMDRITSMRGQFLNESYTFVIGDVAVASLM